MHQRMLCSSANANTAGLLDTFMSHQKQAVRRILLLSHLPVTSCPVAAASLQVTIPNLFDLAPAFGVPTLPKMPPVFNMSFQDTVTQWMAAQAMNLQVTAQQQQQHVSAETEPYCL
jgi:hypothetical protein